MNRLYLSHFVTSIIIILAQVVLLKNIQIIVFDRFMLSILIYPVAIIFLPVDLRREVVILIGFVLGLFIDVFYDSPGVHTAALVLTAFIRHIALRVLEPRQGYKNNTAIDPYAYGVSWFLYYLGTLLFTHILVYFCVDAFTFIFMFKIVMNTMMSFLVSYLIIILYKMII